MNAKNESTPVSEQLIARRAYELWEAEGRPDGKAIDHWIRAEAMLRDAGTASTTAPAADSSASTKATRNRRATSPRSATRREKNVEVAF